LPRVLPVTLNERGGRKHARPNPPVAVRDRRNPWAGRLQSPDYFREPEPGHDDGGVQSQGGGKLSGPEGRFIVSNDHRLGIPRCCGRQAYRDWIVPEGPKPAAVPLVPYRNPSQRLLGSPQQGDPHVALPAAVSALALESTGEWRRWRRPGNRR